MKPKRFQVRRTAGWRMPEGGVYVGRPTIWGNPWKVGGAAHGALGPKEAVAEYERALTRGELVDREGRPLIERVHELRGRDLGCWCPTHNEVGEQFPCHAEVLLRYANADDFT